jgi:hypothetical protein
VLPRIGPRYSLEPAMHSGEAKFVFFSDGLCILTLACGRLPQVERRGHLPVWRAGVSTPLVFAGLAQPQDWRPHWTC